MVHMWKVYVMLYGSQIWYFENCKNWKTETCLKELDEVNVKCHYERCSASEELRSIFGVETSSSDENRQPTYILSCGGKGEKRLKHKYC